MLRNYTDTAPPVQFGADVSSSAAAWPVTSTNGYPDPPFLVGAERGTAKEELVLVTDMTSDTFTVERGYDGTQQVEHDAGTSIEHCSAAIEFREANAHVNDLTQHVTVCTSTTRPTEPVVGQHIYETNTGRSYTWTGLGASTAVGWLPDPGTLLDYQYYNLGDTAMQFSDTVHGLGHALPPHCQWTMPALPRLSGVPTFAPPYTGPYGRRVKIEFFTKGINYDSGANNEFVIAMLQPASPLTFGGSFMHSIVRTVVMGGNSFCYVVCLMDNDHIPSGPAGAVVNLFSLSGRTGAQAIYPDGPMWMAVTMV